ncbi:hypothetical protein WJX72_010342 [[Myrmecia] bisecta]|uniref:HVA22-like protein n=1 Tax=[Myrmecia] bisecta TaxID=41462 RepID=A0AAW1PBD7_9CHLO
MLSFGLSYLACYLAAIIYPTYASFKAVGTAHTGDDTHWLTYWVIYNVLTTAETFLGGFFAWVPFYYEAKFVFIIWLIAPQTKGAQLVYEKYLKPFLVKHASKIDPVFASAESVLNSQQLGNLAKLAETHGPAVANRAIQMAAEQAAKLAEQEKRGGPAPAYAAAPTAPHASSPHSFFSK